MTSLFDLTIDALQISRDISSLAELLESDDEEVRRKALADLEAALLAEEGNNAALAAKADATCAVISKLRAQGNYRRDECYRLSNLSERDYKSAQALEDRLVKALTKLNPEAKKFSFPHYELRRYVSHPLDIEDETSLSPEWLRIIPESREANKIKIKAAIKNGVEIPGCRILKKTTWSIK